MTTNAKNDHHPNISHIHHPNFLRTLRQCSDHAVMGTYTMRLCVVSRQVLINAVPGQVKQHFKWTVIRRIRR